MRHFRIPLFHFRARKRTHTVYPRRTRGPSVSCRTHIRRPNRRIHPLSWTRRIGCPCSARPNRTCTSSRTSRSCRANRSRIAHLLCKDRRFRLRLKHAGVIVVSAKCDLTTSQTIALVFANGITLTARANLVATVGVWGFAV